MYIYNVTVKIDPSIRTEWIQWMQSEHIPEVLATAMFSDSKFCKLLEPKDEEGETYIAQYFTHSLENYNHYIEKFAPILRDKSFEKFGNQFIAFRTLLEVL